MSKIATLLNLNSAYYSIFGNFSITAYGYGAIIENQKSKFANIWFNECDHAGTGR